MAGHEIAAKQQLNLCLEACLTLYCFLVGLNTVIEKLSLNNRYSWFRHGLDDDFYKRFFKLRLNNRLTMFIFRFIAMDLTVCHKRSEHSARPTYKRTYMHTYRRTDFRNTLVTHVSSSSLVLAGLNLCSAICLAKQPVCSELTNNYITGMPQTSK